MNNLLDKELDYFPKLKSKCSKCKEEVILDSNEAYNKKIEHECKDYCSECNKFSVINLAYDGVQIKDLKFCILCELLYVN